MIEGILFHKLNTISDTRGDLTEIFRHQWIQRMGPVQWNYVRSEPDVFRGFHVHLDHTDFLVVLEGSMHLGLRDLRQESATFGQTFMTKLRGSDLTLVQIAPGVGHGFYFSESTSMVYGLTHYWDMSDELGCKWDDPDLNIDWGISGGNPVLSERDKDAPSFQHLMNEFQKRRINGS